MDGGDHSIFGQLVAETVLPGSLCRQARCGAGTVTSDTVTGFIQCFDAVGRVNWTERNRPQNDL